MSVTPKSVVVLAADLFEDMELLYPVARLKEEGVGVVVAGVGMEPVTGKKGHGPVPVDTTVAQLAPERFDALVIPGGYAPDKLRRSPEVLDLVRSFDAAQKPIAFICHAGWVPISAGILRGRRATAVGAIRDDMVNAGVLFSDEPTVVDGNLISARTPEDLGPWLQALLGALSLGDGQSLRRQREDLVRRHMASENDLDFEATFATFSHPRYELMATGQVYDGRQAVREYYRTSRAAFPDQANKVVALHHCDDLVVVEFELSGTHRGPYLGFAPTGRSFRCPMVALFFFDGQGIVNERVFFDAATILHQLGLSFPPAVEP